MIRRPVLFCAILASLLPGAARSEPLSLKAFEALAGKCAPSVSSATLAAIAKVESGFDPLAIHDNSTRKAVAASDELDAVDVIGRLLKEGHSVDVGLMQINSANFASLGLTAQAALDPCVSMRAASTVLESRYAGGETPEAKQQALRQTISAYNTGDLARGFENGYVHKVEVASKQVIPALSQPDGQVDQAEKQEAAPEETWDVWGSYEQRKFASSRQQGRQGSRRIQQDQQPVLFD
ncbi:type IV secretion system protein VirB1 [Phyllobacterium myrsinacearum]|uniref:type IV secretion system lytic transglycosylase VirB1 n=1 Tax=Phyllobacterium myrsinacearum TaxID=28101 RepID=UPI00102A5D6C|nr:type IV secretion system lytic transglycosylase VirB1 [Phyllobacterium myrsinacearum]RZS76860.1 type IV secretion system protein VirB1 [Phyllobacterium myrsinacearum]